jgi:hypothetical protein
MLDFVKIGLFCSFLLLLCNPLKAKVYIENNSVEGKDSTESELKLNVSSDIMSRYIWRGTDYGNSPCIQPTLSVSKGNFELGSWGSIATNSFYKEVDLYAKYTYKQFTFTLTDYYIPSVNGTPASPDTRYFTYSDKNTSHSLEGSLLFKGGDKFPLWLLGGVFFYGNDKRWGYDAVKDANNKTYYSSYLEAGYSFAVQGNSADIFLGFTPSAGAYGNTTGVVNMGITGYRKIKLSSDFELPIKGSLIFNPQTSNVYFVFGVTL